MKTNRIAYLDTSTLDAGDIDFGPLEALGELTLYPFTARDERAARCMDCDIVMVNKVFLDRDVLSAAKEHLQYVIVTATGTNNIDLKAAKEFEIPVSNVSGYSTESVAQHTLTLILNLATNIHRYAAEAPAWAQSPMFTRLDYHVAELSGKTLGIVGLGTIGRRVAEMGACFGMKVVALARQDPSDGPIPRLGYEDFFRRCDFVSLHCPLTPDNEGFINRETLELMKQGAFLINTGRGPLIDETALADALGSGHLGGAALDVLSEEPPKPDHPFLSGQLPNLLITPHTAWASLESRTRLLEAVCANIRAFQGGGTLLNRVA